MSDIQLLGELGRRDIGENRDQEAAPKAAACAALGLPVTWHFVGQLQTNKVASVVSYAEVIHSVDRLRLVRVLGSRARAAGRTVTCLVQVSLDGDPARGGAFGRRWPPWPTRWPARTAWSWAASWPWRRSGCRLRPRSASSGKWPTTVRSAHPGAVMISAGMSADLEQAIGAGATHVRVGTALLGGRRAFVR